MLGFSEQVIARRYRKLRPEGVDADLWCGQPRDLRPARGTLRVHCRPNGTAALADALAKRDDVAWVALSAAGSEVLFSVRSLWAEEREALLGQLLPRSTQVLDVQASIVLRYFRGLGADDWDVLSGWLTDAQSDTLRSISHDSAPALPTGSVELQPHDDAIIAALTRDGRASYAQLASAASISEGRAARRVARLIGSRALLIDMDLAAGALGFDVSAYLRCGVHPGALERIGRALSELTGVAFVAAVTGSDNLFASVECRSLADLYDFLSNEVGAIDGIESVELAPIGRVVKQSGALVISGRLVDAAPSRVRAVSAASTAGRPRTAR